MKSHLVEMLNEAIIIIIMALMNQTMFLKFMF